MNTGNMSNDEAKSIGDFIEQLNNIEPYQFGHTERKSRYFK